LSVEAILLAHENPLVMRRTEEVCKLAVLDPLTKLYNRRSGELRLAEEISRSHRYSLPLAAIRIDVNGLKQINDTFGHAVRDQLIKHLAERLQRAIRGSDVAVRLGRGEFLVLLPECKLGDVHSVLDRLSGMSMNCSGKIIPLTFTAGWTDYIPAESPEEFLRRADSALYVNKHAGKEKSGPY
jgi:diguanylate cyclase (GGDEF)-like protein